MGQKNSKAPNYQGQAQQQSQQPWQQSSGRGSTQGLNNYTPSAAGQAKLAAANSFLRQGGSFSPGRDYGQNPETSDEMGARHAQHNANRSPENRATQSRLQAQHEGTWQAPQQQPGQQSGQQPGQQPQGKGKKAQAPSYQGASQQRPQQPQPQQYRQPQQQPQQQQPQQYYGQGSNLLLRNRPAPQGYQGGYYK